MQTRDWMKALSVLALIVCPLKVKGQISGDAIVDKLVRMGYENVRWIETPEERIYTIESNEEKRIGLGIANALKTIQDGGLPAEKRCRVIVTDNNIPQVALSYYSPHDSATVRPADWNVSYQLDESWEKVKKKPKRNSSLFKVEVVVYPQLSYKNMIITQIYQILFDLSPAVEVSLWPGGKLTGMVKIPLYNDGYGVLEDQVHPGHLTISQRFRLPYHIKGKATFGYFNTDRWGGDLQLFYPFADQRFSVTGRISYVGIGYWDGFRLHYDDKMKTTWSVGGHFYWPRYNTQFSLKAEQYLLKEKGVKFEMIRHFRYASVGFYAEKAEHAKANGGFRFQILLPAYRMKRHGYVPRVNTSNNMGIIYNANNERKYYREFKAEVSDNIMQDNRYNPYFIKSELQNY
ncbi:hypothetical protein [Phocaeicola abscessus]|uniref:hypothetical protein n=2 Tax=Phocaeicola abscessus TaxID=555313 RepID=UPI0006857C51|nr:hypothetical protein [Phocaeicola abscessus]